MNRVLPVGQAILCVLCILTACIHNATACAPDVKSEKPWSEILKDDYTYADQVFIGTVTEVQKTFPSGPDGIVVDRIRFSVKEMIKGDVDSVDYAETQNFDGFTSGCGLRLRVGERNLIMIRHQQLNRAIAIDRPWYTEDPEIMVKTVRGFRDQPDVKPHDLQQK